MTRQSTIDRAEQLDRPGIAFIGRFTVDGQRFDFQVSEADLGRDAQWASTILAGYGVQRGSRILVTALNWHSPWFDAFRDAATLLGACHSNAEAWGWDAGRLDMFCRRLDLQVVVGLTGESVTSLANIVSPAERLGTIPHVLAQPDGVEPLREAGLDPGVVTPLGPALLVSAPDGSGLCFDDAEWAVEDRDGELLVTTVGPRSTRFEGQRTGVAGRLDETPAGPRVVLA